MHVGVQFATGNRQLHTQFARALNLWSDILDMDWYTDNTEACSIYVTESATGFDPDVIALAFPDTGVITFLSNRTYQWSKKDRFEVSTHELGHQFGLEHNTTDPISVMGKAQGDDPLLILDAQDLAALSKQHALRSIPILQ